MIGHKILHYEIIEELGRGGMGVVYRAKDIKLKREVAIKFLPESISGNEEERERFKIEAQAAAALNHPNIATIFAIEESDEDNPAGLGNLFIVMEYIEGRELKNLIGNNRDPSLSNDELTNYAIQIAAGLQAAHDKGIVHRDIKSSNIMITKSGQIKIMDFGLAKMQGSTLLTKVGTTLGTTAYMSPEQVRGEEADTRSDIWSFGVLLYELATRQLPFTGVYEQAIMYGIVNESPIPVTGLNASIPPELEFIINRCLEKEPSARYQTVSEILSALKGEKKPLTESHISVVPVKSKLPIFSNRKILLPITVIFATAAIIWLLVFSGGLVVDWFHSESPGQHLSVLPFANIGNDTRDQAFCDGLIEIITSKLTRLEQFHGSLWVVPASEVLQNKITSPGEAYKYFGANLAVSGSLQRMNKSFRLILNLVDAKNLRQINSAVIDVTDEDIITLQDKLVTRLLQMLNLELNPKTYEIIQADQTQVSVAYEFYLQGRGYLQRYEETSNVDAAIGLFKLAVEQDSLYALAYAGLGEAYWRKYENQKDVQWVNRAIQECQRAFELNNELVPVNVTLGMIHSGTGHYMVAVEDFRRALETDATHADAYRGLAKAYEALDKLEKAEATYKKAVALKPDYWAGYNELGAFFYRHSRYEEAIEQFRQVVKLTPDNYRGYNNLGAIYYLLQRWQDARQAFEHSISLKQSYSVASNLGTLYYIEGNYPGAARMYKLALEINDKDYQVWGNLASAYEQIPAEKHKAKETYLRTITLAKEQLSVNPSDPQIISDLAGYYAMLGEEKNAIDFITEALEIAPNDARVLFRAGSTFEQLGQREQALHWIGKALQNGYSRSDIEYQPELRRLAADSRFQQLLKENEKGSSENSP